MFVLSPIPKTVESMWENPKVAVRVTYHCLGLRPEKVMIIKAELIVTFLPPVYQFFLVGIMKVYDVV